MFKVPGSIPTMGKISLPKTPTKKNVTKNVLRLENENGGSSGNGIKAVHSSSKKKNINNFFYFINYITSSFF